MHRFDRLGVQIDYPMGVLMIQYSSDSFSVVDVKSKQHLDPTLMEMKDYVLANPLKLSSKG